MMKLRIILPVALVSMLFMTSPMFAQTATEAFCNGEGAGTAVCEGFNAGAGGDPLLGNSGGVFTTIIDILSWVIAIASVIGVVIGGYRYTFAGSDPQKAAAARSTIIYSLVGVGVAIVARAIVSYVLSETN